METVLETLDKTVPPSLTKYDAFPKIPSSYKSKSSGGGLVSILVMLLAFVLMLNDIGEYFWGWPDTEFAIDQGNSFMKINVDLIVAMPCRYLSIDLRDAIGDRLMLSGGVRRDGTKFDVGQATTLKAHSEALSAKEVVAQARYSRGFFGNLFTGRGSDGFKPTYNSVPHGSACRVWGQVEAKKVTANLHITTLGHGYASHDHVDHNKMNLSHVINEFSFGPHFPDISQPLDSSFELTHDPFVAYQYFIHVVPTTYIPAWSSPLDTNQYSVTHYTRVLEHGKGTPGIFFKFEVDPLRITVWQRTTSFATLLMRCVGVLGGVFVCTSYFYRITSKTIEIVAGDNSETIAPTASSSGAKVGLRAKWGGANLRSRPTGRMVPQGSGWVREGGSTPYSGTPTSSTFSGYTGTPTTAGFPTSPYPPPTPNLQAAMNTGLPSSVPPTPRSATGLGFQGIQYGSPGSAGFPPMSPRPTHGRSASAVLSPPGRQAAYPTSPYLPTTPSTPGTPAMEGPGKKDD